MAQLNQVYVREIKTKSGTQQTTGVVHVYDEPADALKIEPKYIITRNKVKQQEPETEVEPEKPTEEEEK
jgi:ribosomal protein S24E